MRHRGLCNGWLGFEWYRLKVSNKDYLEKAKNEAKTIRDTDSDNEKDVLDQVVRRAERKCYLESPFAELETDDYPGAAEIEQCDKTLSEEKTAAKTVATHLDTTLALANPDQLPPQQQENAQGSLEPMITRAENENISHQPISAHRKSQSCPATPEIPTSILRNLSAQTTGNESRAGKEVSFELRENTTNQPLEMNASKRSYGSNAPVGSEEAERLARLRYAERDEIDWDSQLFKLLYTRVSAFFQRRILQLHEREPRGTSTEERTTQTEFMADRVVRRPLTSEEQELLRCIGLDAFMTLRFLRFGFDISFWSFLLSVVLILPIYRSQRGEIDGFYSITTLSLEDGSPHFWPVMIFAFLQYLYILRRLWIEWELFLPLRYDFLEHGDFQKEKYRKQYQLSCLVEYVPRSQKHNKELYQFFDALFPGQVRRAEVLLNTEFLRSLIRDRLNHIIAYEDVYAKKVHRWAVYMRAAAAENPSQRLKKLLVREPKEPKCIVTHKMQREDAGNAFFNPYNKIVKDPRTYPALRWHHYMIHKLNKAIDDEYVRLVLAKHKPVPHFNENRIAKWLGLKFLTGSDTSRLHSSTAFVEFASLTAKQEAIQCNITGQNNLLLVSPVPEIRDVIWENCHVSRALIETRRYWANVVLVGGLVGWSFLVSLIRNYDNLSSNVPFDIAENPSVAVFLDIYLPALIVEGLVRIIPFAIRFISVWIRFKCQSEIDHYVLKWYFGFRLFTFIFVLVGGELVQSGEELVQDPIDFLKSLTSKAIENSQFFISYVIVTGSIQVFLRLSQVHNLLIAWFVQLVITEEAMSQRRLHRLKTSLKQFHLDEFLPLFSFVFMVGALYVALAPVAGCVVAAFFHLAYKVFKFMTLYVYGKRYEGGGFLWYTVSNIIFSVLYIMILIIAAYFSLHASGLIAGIFTLLVFVCFAVQRDIHRVFVVPSRTLSLSKARAIEAKYCRHECRSTRQRKVDELRRLEEELDMYFPEADERDTDEEVANLSKRLLHDAMAADFEPSDPLAESVDRADRDISNEERTKLMESFERRYAAEDSFSDLTSSDSSGVGADFFIYRQPSLNRATWELGPRPYRRQIERDDATEIWR